MNIYIYCDNKLNLLDGISNDDNAIVPAMTRIPDFPFFASDSGDDIENRRVRD